MSRLFEVAPFGLDAEAKSLRKIFADGPHLLNRHFGPFPQKGLAERGQIFMGFSAGPGLQNRPEEKNQKHRPGPEMGTLQAIPSIGNSGPKAFTVINLVYPAAKA